MRYDRFPVEIDDTYEPQLGDRVERTNTRTGTVAIATVTEIVRNDYRWIAVYADDITILGDGYSNLDGYTYRLLSRKKEYKVGDIIEGVVDGDKLPVGTILKRVPTRTRMPEPIYSVVVLGTSGLSGEMGRANRYRRTDVVRSWPSIRGQWRIDYLPEV